MNLANSHSRESPLPHQSHHHQQKRLAQTLPRKTGQVQDHKLIKPPQAGFPRSETSPRSRNPTGVKTCPSPQTEFCSFMIVPRAGPLLPNQGDIRYSGGGCRKAENERTQESIASQDRHAAIEPPL